MHLFLQNGKDFVNRLHKAIASAQPGDRITLEPGEYRVNLCDVPARPIDGACYNGTGDKQVLFPLENKEGITVDGGGAVLRLQGRITPFTITRCKDVTVRNFTLDTDRAFYSQGTILESTKNRLVIDIQPEKYPHTVEDGVVTFLSDTWQMRSDEYDLFLQPFDPATCAPSCGMPCRFVRNDPQGLRPIEGPSAAPIFSALFSRTPQGQLLLTGDDLYVYPVGHIMVILHEPRICPGIFAIDSQNTTLEKIRMKACGSMGIVLQNCTDALVREIDVRRDPTDEGMLSINADVIHGIVCRGSLTIEDCCFENMDDDAINIHGLYTQVTALGDGQLTAKLMHNGYHGIELFHPGDRLAVYRGHTQEQVAELVVRSAKALDPAQILLQVEGDLSQASVGDFVDVLSAQPDLYIRRCRTGYNRPRGFLISTGGHVEIADCVFANSSCAIYFAGDTSYWCESGPARDVVIRNNVFLDCGYADESYVIAVKPQFTPTEAAPYFHSGIRVEDNVFYTRQNRLLRLLQANDVVFRRNRVTRIQSDTAVWQEAYAECEGCGRVVLE